MTDGGFLYSLAPAGGDGDGDGSSSDGDGSAGGGALILPENNNKK